LGDYVHDGDMFIQLRISLWSTEFINSLRINYEL